MKLLICTVYRPPNAKVSWWSLFEEMLQDVKHTFLGHIVITGDLNSDFKTLNGTKLLELASLYNFEIHIDKTTHVTNDTILDQFITNCSSFIKK